MVCRTTPLYCYFLFWFHPCLVSSPICIKYRSARFHPPPLVPRHDPTLITNPCLFSSVCHSGFFLRLEIERGGGGFGRKTESFLDLSFPRHLLSLSFLPPIDIRHYIHRSHSKKSSFPPFSPCDIIFCPACLLVYFVGSVVSFFLLTASFYHDLIADLSILFCFRILELDTYTCRYPVHIPPSPLSSPCCITPHTNMNSNSNSNSTPLGLKLS